MSTSLDLKDFSITSVSGTIQEARVEALPNPLLVGTWRGTGFNQIWRPFHGSQDRFLELNETTEELQFVEIPGDGTMKECDGCGKPCPDSSLSPIGDGSIKVCQTCYAVATATVLTARPANGASG